MTEPIADFIVIQRLLPGDEERLRDLRLRALRDSPDEFVTTLEQVLALPPRRQHVHDIEMEVSLPRPR